MRGSEGRRMHIKRRHESLGASDKVLPGRPPGAANSPSYGMAVYLPPKPPRTVDRTRATTPLGMVRCGAA